MHHRAGNKIYAAEDNGSKSIWFCSQVMYYICFNFDVDFAGWKTRMALVRAEKRLT